MPINWYGQLYSSIKLYCKVWYSLLSCIAWLLNDDYISSSHSLFLAFLICIVQSSSPVAVIPRWMNMFIVCATWLYPNCSGRSQVLIPRKGFFLLLLNQWAGKVFKNSSGNSSMINRKSATISVFLQIYCAS